MSEQNAGPSSRQAAATYSAATAATDQRALEAHVLLKSALMLEDLAVRLRKGEAVGFEEVGEILDHNQKLWVVLSTDATSKASPLPQEIKDNIASLAVFIFKRTLEVRIDTQPDKLNILISINRNIASGLMKKAPGVNAPSAPETPQRGGADSVV